MLQSGLLGLLHIIFPRLCEKNNGLAVFLAAE